MAQSMHDVSDPRNASILINVNGELKPRDQAMVSVFDSGFILGDGVWEGLRVHKGRIAFLDLHLDRLFEGAKAIAMDIGLSREALVERLYETLDANGMDERPAQAGADEGLMLDPHGFVATCNSTHFFIVRKGEVWTSTGDYCLGGITRGNVIRICREAGIPVLEKNFSLTEVYGAEEAFVTGTFAGVVPVRTIDGREISEGRGPMVDRLQGLYRALIEADASTEGRR